MCYPLQESIQFRYHPFIIILHQEPFLKRRKRSTHQGPDRRLESPMSDLIERRSNPKALQHSEEIGPMHPIERLLRIYEEEERLSVGPVRFVY
ncbi:hypothetical protein NDU88_005061 [Pleurodeles waltl]|uniref:Uncharacterized protein n=1 Tax=Pleurodeles waltl TaxID=8319 RepID=A0AAV7MV73_PLEWA|nr:hypothetical protein NDU88_005061 [Pleurodeles waltl]